MWTCGISAILLFCFSGFYCVLFFWVHILFYSVLFFCVHILFYCVLFFCVHILFYCVLINPFLEKLVSLYFLIPVLTAVRNRNYKIRKITYTQTFASFTNLHTKIDNGVRLQTQLYAKRNDFIFPMLSLRSYVRVFSLLFVFTFLCPCFFPIICLFVLMSVFCQEAVWVEGLLCLK
jgi:hypothetical protein